LFIGLEALVGNAILAGWAGFVERALGIDLFGRLADALIAGGEAVVDELARIQVGAGIVAITVCATLRGARTGLGRPAARLGRRIGNAPASGAVANLPRGTICVGRAGRLANAGNTDLTPRARRLRASRRRVGNTYALIADITRLAGRRGVAANLAFAIRANLARPAFIAVVAADKAKTIEAEGSVRTIGVLRAAAGGDVRVAGGRATLTSLTTLASTSALTYMRVGRMTAITVTNDAVLALLIALNGGFTVRAAAPAGAAR